MLQDDIKKAVESIEIKADEKEKMLRNCKKEAARRKEYAAPPVKSKWVSAWIPATACFVACVILCCVLFLRTDRQQKHILETKLSHTPYSVSVLTYAQGRVAASEKISSDITELQPQNIGTSMHGFLFSLETNERGVFISCPEGAVLVYDNPADFSKGIYRTPATEYTLRGEEVLAWVSENGGILKIYNASGNQCVQVVSVQKRIWEENSDSYYAASYPIYKANETVTCGAYTMDFAFLNSAIAYTVEDISCDISKNQILYTVSVCVQNKTTQTLCLYTGNAVLSDLSLLGSIEPTAVYENELATTKVLLSPNETKQLRFEYSVSADNQNPLYFSLNTKGVTSTKTEASSWIQFFEVAADKR